MIALALTIIGLVALLAWLFVDSEKRVTAAKLACKSLHDEALANMARANEAERRLEAADDLIRSAARSAPRQRREPVSVPAAACPVCHTWEVRNTIATASRVPVLGVSAQDGWRAPFTVRWGNA